MYRHSDATRNSGDFRITASIDRVRHVFIYLQRLKNNNMRQNPYIYDTFNITGADPAVANLLTCRLEYGNGVFYPELDYDSESKTRIFSDIMNYSWQKNDYNTGTQLNVSNFESLYLIFYFDLSYQTEQVRRDPKQLMLRYRINQASTVDFRVHVIAFFMNKIL